ncbi:MAG: hypothetical protein ACKV1O_29140 [Saprospiraceae bacterium]
MKIKWSLPAIVCFTLLSLTDCRYETDQVNESSAQRIELHPEVDSLRTIKVEDGRTRRDSIRKKMERKGYMCSPEYYKDHPPHADFLGRTHSGSLTTQRLWGLYAPQAPDFENESNTDVYSYKVLVKRKNKKIARFFNKGCAFQKELMEFKHYKTRFGDTLLFYDIKYKLKNGKVITLPPLEWEVKFQF